MHPGLPFEVAKDKKLHIKPICWSSEPEVLSWKMKISVESIEETLKNLLYQSLLDSKPVKPLFLKEYDDELNKTAAHLRDREKITIYVDEEKNGF